MGNMCMFLLMTTNPCGSQNHIFTCEPIIPKNKMHEHICHMCHMWCHLNSFLNSFQM